MFQSKWIRRALVLAAASSASGAFAAASLDLNISATVTGTCKLISVPAMSFTLDPSVGTDVTKTSAVIYRCTKGTAAGAIKVGGADASTGYTSGATVALGALKGTGTNTDALKFSVSWTNPAASAVGLGLGTGNDLPPVTLTGKILGNDYVNITADTYSGAVPVTIEP